MATCASRYFVTANRACPESLSLSASSIKEQIWTYRSSADCPRSATGARNNKAVAKTQWNLMAGSLGSAGNLWQRFCRCNRDQQKEAEFTGRVERKARDERPKDQ